MKFSPKIIIIIVLVITIAGFGISQIIKKSDPAAENQKLVDKVATLMVLPSEQPIIATINEADVLVKEQAFYQGSANGDKLIIFPKAQKAVIYSPSRNIIINSGPFVINSGQTQ